MKLPKLQHIPKQQQASVKVKHVSENESLEWLNDEEEKRQVSINIKKDKNADAWPEISKLEKIVADDGNEQYQDYFYHNNENVPKNGTPRKLKKVSNNKVGAALTPRDGSNNGNGELEEPEYNAIPYKMDEAEK